jgi:hypothetical protein
VRKPSSAKASHSFAPLSKPMSSCVTTGTS